MECVCARGTGREKERKSVEEDGMKDGEREEGGKAMRKAGNRGDSIEMTLSSRAGNI